MIIPLRYVAKKFRRGDFICVDHNFILLADDAVYFFWRERILFEKKALDLVLYFPVDIFQKMKLFCRHLLHQLLPQDKVLVYSEQNISDISIAILIWLEQGFFEFIVAHLRYICLLQQFADQIQRIDKTIANLSLEKSKLFFQVLSDSFS